MGPSTAIFLRASGQIPLRAELVGRVAVAVAVGVGFDVILRYFIWLCWFDCARSSILPDVSRYPSKEFCFIGRLVYLAEFQWLFDGINAPFECRPRVKREGVGETHVERACMESESQMSEESVKGKNFLRTQMLRWSGISNVQISFRQSYYNPIHFFFYFLKKEYREKKKVLPSFEEKAKHLCTKTKWIVNRCTAHLWSNKFFSIHWQTIQNRRRRHCSRADITIQFTQLWKSQIPTMTRDSQKVIVYTWSIMGK